MSATLILARVGGAAAVAVTALGLLAGPSTAQTLDTPSGGSTTGHGSITSHSGPDWTDVGSGALGGVALAGSAVAAASMLRRRQQPRPA